MLIGAQGVNPAQELFDRVALEKLVVWRRKEEAVAPSEFEGFDVLVVVIYQSVVW